MERALQTSKRSTETMHEEVGRLRRELQEREQRAATEREAVLQRTEAVEEERQKWEMRWCDKITGVEEELRAAGVGRDKVLEMEIQLELAMTKLHSTEAVLSGLSEKNELLQRENLALIERGRELESSPQKATLK